MSRNNADAESVGATLGSGHRSLIKITAVAVAPACVQNADRRVFDSAVLGFAVVRFHANVIWSDVSEINMRTELERFADQNVLSIFVGDLHVVDANLRPIFPHSRFPLTQLRRRFTTV